MINFDGNSVQLTDTKYSFDLDADGESDQISFVDAKSGFLTIDRNGDGKINDGSELFGPKTGDGFTELESYDSDHNNWIDENDPIYAELHIWSKDSQGNDLLTSLKQKGIGAIYLNHEDTPFKISDNRNNAQGELWSSGIYVSEVGIIGTMQQIDLIV